MGFSKLKVSTTASTGTAEDLGGTLARSASRMSDSASSLNASLRTRQSIAMTTAGVAAYGMRRNKHAKVWEIYPDDVEEYLECAGVLDVEEVEEHERETRESATLANPKPSSGYPSVDSSESASPIITGLSKSSPALASSLLPTAVITAARTHSRPSSVEGSPIGRTPTSHSSSDYSPYRTGSLGSGFARSSQSQPMSFTSKSVDLPTPLPRVLAQQSKSTDYLPEVSVTSLNSPITRPSSHKAPSLQLKSPALLTSPVQRAGSIKLSPSEGLRHTLSRRIDKIRGKGASNESEFDLTSMHNASMTDIAFSPDPSDGESSSVAVSGSVPSLFKSPVSLNREKIGFRRGKLYKPEHSLEDEMHESRRRSIIEDGTGRRRRGVRNAIWASVRSGFKGPLEPLVVGTDLDDVAALRRRRMRLAAEESDDEEIKPVREVLDLGEDDSVRLNRYIVLFPLTFDTRQLMPCSLS